MTASRAASLAMLLTLAPLTARAEVYYWDTSMAELVGRVVGAAGYGAHWSKVLGLEAASDAAEARASHGGVGAAARVGLETMRPSGLGRDFDIYYTFERDREKMPAMPGNPSPEDGSLVSLGADVNKAFGSVNLTIVEMQKGKPVMRSFASRPLVRSFSGRPLVTVRYEMLHEEQGEDPARRGFPTRFDFLLGGPDGKVKTPRGALMQRVAGFLFRVAYELAQPSARERDAAAFLSPVRSAERRRVLLK